MKFNRLGKLVTVMVLTAVITGVFIAPATMAKERDWLSEWSDKYDLWGVDLVYDCYFRESGPCEEEGCSAAYVWDALNCCIDVSVNPDYDLDVAIELYVYRPWPEDSFRPVPGTYTDHNWEGGEESLFYCVDPSDFHLSELTDGLLIVVVSAVDGSGYYWIDID